MLRRFWAWLTEPEDAEAALGASAADPFPDRINVVSEPPTQALRAVVVTLQTGTVIRGALVTQAANGLVLRHAAVFDVPEGGAGGRWVPIDGDAVCPVENIDYWQDALDASLLELGVQQT